MGKSVRGGSMGTFRAVCSPALVAVAGVAILLSGCSQGASKTEAPQAKPVAATTTQAQQDIEAKRAADVKKTKDDAAKAAEAKAAEVKAAATNAAKAAAAKAAAKTAITRCSEFGPLTRGGRLGGTGAGPNTSCAFANKVWDEMPNGVDGQISYDVKSPVTGTTYTMKCVLGHDVVNSTMPKGVVKDVCRGGKDVVVYLWPST